MSQFMLVQAAAPSSSIEDIVYERINQDTYFLSEGINELFPDNSIPVWEVSPMDLLADEARDAILDGKSIKITRLGRLLKNSISANDSFCLFWASDFHDLPSPQTEAELFQIVSEQLDSYGSWNWETFSTARLNYYN